MLGQVDKYTWKDTGSSFGLADVLAAYLLGQLEQREVIQGKRRAVHEHYTRELAPLADELEFELMETPAGSGSAYHMFYVLLPAPSPQGRRRWRRCGKMGVHATFHYIPLHSSDAGRAFAARPTDCPVSDDISGRLLRLPFYNNLGGRRPRPRGGDVPLLRAGNPAGLAGDVARTAPCPAGVLVAEPTGLLVVPRPRRSPARRLRSVPGQRRGGPWTWAVPTPRASAGCAGTIPA